MIIIKYLVLKTPSGENYEKFIKYVCDKSNIISFKIITRVAHEKEDKREIKKICKLLNIPLEEIIKNYNSSNFIGNLCNKLKDQKRITRKWTNSLKRIEKKNYFSKKEIEAIKQEHIKMNIEDIILGSIGKTIYDDKIIKIEGLLEKDFIKKEMFLKHSRFVNDYNIYYYRISKTIENLLINQKGLYTRFPEFPEDIKFLKDDNIWIEIISHEEICRINVKDENEYNYLQSLGLELKLEI